MVTRRCIKSCLIWSKTPNLFGRDASSYEEPKRAVHDDDLGPLIATDMTRCIQCTRCVRFGEEIAGLPELGGIGRGEHLQISTAIEHSMQSEVSGNIIDLCPVGALTSKPFRYTARPWELSQSSGIAPHDCLGSHVYWQTRRNHLMRVVPKEFEAINETWLSDRDRFSYLGLQHHARAAVPKIKRNGLWEEVDWSTALGFAAQGIAKIINDHGPEQFAAFASPSSSLEECYLLQKSLRELGVNNLDYRLKQSDFRDQGLQGLMPISHFSYADLDKQAQILIIGCNVDKEVPLAGLRLRKAFLNHAKLMALNAVDYDYRFDLAHKIIVSPNLFREKLASILAALISDPAQLSDEEKRLITGVVPDEAARDIAGLLSQAQSVILSGALVEHHPQASILRTLLASIARHSGAQTLSLTTGANAAGAALAGMLPHRSALGKSNESQGLNVQQALQASLKGYLLLGVDPEFDFADPSLAKQAVSSAECVVVLSAFDNESIREYADVILPIAPYAESSGTYINLNGDWQSTTGAVAPYEQARPAWKILRVLANLLHCKGFDYVSSQDVLEEVKSAYAMANPASESLYYPETLQNPEPSLVRIGEWPLYRSDAIVRHAEALQRCGAAELACIRIHPQTAQRLGLGESEASVSQGEISVKLPLIRDDRIALDTVWVPSGMPETVHLGQAFGAITIE